MLKCPRIEQLNEAWYYYDRYRAHSLPEGVLPQKQEAHEGDCAEKVLPEKA